VVCVLSSRHVRLCHPHDEVVALCRHESVGCGEVRVMCVSSHLSTPPAHRTIAGTSTCLRKHIIKFTSQTLQLLSLRFACSYGEKKIKSHLVIVKRSLNVCRTVWNTLTSAGRRHNPNAVWKRRHQVHHRLGDGCEDRREMEKEPRGKKQLLCNALSGGDGEWIVCGEGIETGVREC
jgi:hypothetical protein